MSVCAAGKIRILLSTGCGEIKGRILRLLPALRIDAELIRAQGREIPSMLGERAFDAVILPHCELELAEDIARHSEAAVLLLCERGELDDAQSACVPLGISAAEYRELERVFPLLLSECVKLRVLRLQANTLRRKLSDTRLVSRAKLLLMTRLNMSEEEAHKYIEKTAMSTGAKRGEVAQSIIRTYEE